MEGEAEIEYLRTVLYEVESAPRRDGAERDPRRAEKPGLLKVLQAAGSRKKPADFLRYTSSDGFEILVGRNNLQNDKLTLHTARGRDLWFHVQKAPGSHCVVMSRGEDIPDTTKRGGRRAGRPCIRARTAVQRSPWTPPRSKKNIWKANGAKPGMVLYEVYDGLRDAA